MVENFSLKLFQIDIDSAIKGYEKSVSHRNKTLSCQSAKAIASLRHLLSLPWEDVKACLTQVSEYLEIMPTGFWIFQGETAVLKRFIQEIVDIHTKIQMEDDALDEKAKRDALKSQGD